MMKKILTLIFLISIFAQTRAQNTTENLIIFGVPQYLFVNATRIDVDFRKANTNNWWTITPYYYSDKSSLDPFGLSESSSYDAHSYDEMIGFGLGIERRMLISKTIENEGFYLKYGANYKNFSIKGSNFTFREFIDDDGLTKQGMRDGDYKITINSYCGLAAIGYQFELLPKLYLDAYLGFGIKFSTHKSTDKVTIKYNRNVCDYGFSGTQFIAGIRLGVAI